MVMVIANEWLPCTKMLTMGAAPPPKGSLHKQVALIVFLGEVYNSPQCRSLKL